MPLISECHMTQADLSKRKGEFNFSLLQTHSFLFFVKICKHASICESWQVWFELEDDVGHFPLGIAPQALKPSLTNNQKVLRQWGKVGMRWNHSSSGTSNNGVSMKAQKNKTTNLNHMKQANWPKLFRKQDNSASSLRSNYCKRLWTKKKY